MVHHQRILIEFRTKVSRVGNLFYEYGKLEGSVMKLCYMELFGLKEVI